jgi:hypothetical protein
VQDRGDINGTGKNVYVGMLLVFKHNKETENIKIKTPGCNLDAKRNLLTPTYMKPHIFIFN